MANRIADPTKYTEKTTLGGAEYLHSNDASTDKVIKISTILSYFRSLVNTYTKAQGVTPAALTSGSSVATDASLSNNFTLTLATNATLANPTNLIAGHVYNWIITQDATGSRTLAYGTLFKWPGGTAPVLSTTSSAVDLISAIYDGTRLVANFNKGYA